MDNAKLVEKWRDLNKEDSRNSSYVVEAGDALAAALEDAEREIVEIAGEAAQAKMERDQFRAEVERLKGVVQNNIDWRTAHDTLRAKLDGAVRGLGVVGDYLVDRNL